MEGLLDPGFLWGIVCGLLVVGMAYGDLLVRTKGNSSRIEQVHRDHQAHEIVTAETLERIATGQSVLRTEYTDRLARIETKIDLLVGGKK